MVARKSSRGPQARRVAPQRGGQWHVVFLAVLALLVGIAAGWHFRDSGMAANAAPGVTSQAPKSAAMRMGEMEREGRKAVDAWLKTVSSGNTAAVRAVLAPEFQVTRSDGSAYNAGEYVRSGLPKVDAPIVDRLAITSNGDHLITRYWVKTTETTGGKRVETFAPRMTVFRKSGEGWLVVAHANFAAVPR
jgi:hypothetical protein